MENREYQSVDEVKKSLHQLYNSKINDLEVLKIGLEELRDKEEERIRRAVREREEEKIEELQEANAHILASERERLFREYEQREHEMKARYAKMEVDFKRRVQEKARVMVQEYCDELKQGLDKVKSALANMETSMSKLIEMREMRLSDDSAAVSTSQENRDYTGALYSSEDSVAMQLEEEFRGLLSEQDKKLESIANLINRE